ncbi:YraN family protein [bacterium]|nr:YraN family protein [bacterium]
MNKKEFGNIGEDFACEYLRKNGYEIVERNVHFSRFCEIDIIAKNKNQYIFVEVKTRKNDSFGTPLEAITKTKYNHIKTGVMTYISQHKIHSYRIDAIGITLYPELKVQHLKNI